jgi:HSP20 family protein
MQRWNPISDMISLRDAMDRLFAESFVRPGAGLARTGEMMMPLDMYEQGDNLVVKTSLPGVKPEDIDIQVHGDTLTITGEMKSEYENQNQDQQDSQNQDQQNNQNQGRRGGGRNWYVREHRSGRFTRSVSLPYPVQADQCQADFENGVLTLTLPKAEEAKPKRIQVQSKQQQEG